MIVTRRQCMQCMWGTVLALHAAPSPRRESTFTYSSQDRDDRRPSLAGEPAIKLREIHLQCDDPARVETFYRDTMKLPVRRNEQDRVEVRIGQSVLVFSAAQEGQRPFYHFALNISNNKFAEAKRWIASRIGLVVAPDGRDQFHFSSRDADACYFLDPAGNLVEFIAHHRLSNRRNGNFDADDLLDVSEIGVVVSELAKTLDTIKVQVNAQPYAPPFGDEFAAVGDERGFLIVVKNKRLWYPRRERRASPYTTSIVMPGSTAKQFELADARTTFNITE